VLFTRRDHMVLGLIGLQPQPRRGQRLVWRA
jgi:hypothetical protein